MRSLLRHLFIDHLTYDSARTRELPGHYPFVVQKFYIDEFTAKWEAPAQALCRALHNTLSQHVRALISQHLATLGQGSLEQRVTWVSPSEVNAAVHCVSQNYRSGLYEAAR